MDDPSKITIVCGSPGAGKSTYAKGLSLSQGAVLLDIDTCSERLVMAGLSMSGRDPLDRDSAAFKKHFRDAIYETLFNIAEENIPHQDVVIVGPFTKEIRQPGWLEGLQQRFGCVVNIHYVYCKPNERRERLTKRANPRDAGKFIAYETFNQYYGDESPPEFEHTLIDTSNPISS